MSTYLLTWLLFLLITVTSPSQASSLSPLHSCQSGEAIETWEASLPSLSAVQQIDTLLLMAQNYRALDHWDKAEQTLQQAQSIVKQPHVDKLRPALVWNGRSEICLLMRRLKEAEQFAEEGVALARQSKNPVILATLLNTQGNVWTATMEEADKDDLKEVYERAEQSYVEGLKIIQSLSAPPLELEIAVLINHAKLYLSVGDKSPALFTFSSSYATSSQWQQENNEKARKLLQQALTHWQQLPASEEKGMLGLSVGYWLEQAQGDRQTVFEIYNSYAGNSADQVQNANPLLTGYANGLLGEWWLTHQQFSQADRCLRRAIFYTAQLEAPDVLSRWYWQTGRLQEAQGQLEKAKSAYEFAAIKLLQPIRPALLFGYREQQSFRNSTGRVYLDLVQLLLQQAKAAADEKQRQELFKKAQEVLEQFKMVELEYYFKEDCTIKAQPTSIQQLLSRSPATAVLYPIVLPKHTVLLLMLADGSIQSFEAPVPITADQLTQQVKDWQALLKNTQATNLIKILAGGQELYHLLIAPLEATLQTHQITTLVIVPDEVLRTIPFAALSEGTVETFLIKKYALAVTPGLSMTISPTEGSQGHCSPSLVNGLSVGVKGFSQLAKVEELVKEVQQICPQTTILLNEAFKLEPLASRLKEEEYQTLLFATHGKFSPDPNQSFLLTFEGELWFNKYRDLLRSRKLQQAPIALLALTACETAQGNDLASFGLAGLSVKTGVESVLGSLWKVDESATMTLMLEFLKYWQSHPQETKAKALQQAQLAVIASQPEPFFWAAFLLIGNWL